MQVQFMSVYEGLLETPDLDPVRDAVVNST